MTTTPRTVKRSRPLHGGWPDDKPGAQITDDSVALNEVEAERRGKRFRKAMALNDDHFKFTKEERYELARMIVGVDTESGGSWKDLTSKQLHDLITMMEGYAYINWLIGERNAYSQEG